MNIVHSRDSWMVGLECRQSVHIIHQQSQDDTFESEKVLSLSSAFTLSAL